MRNPATIAFIACSRLSAAVSTLFLARAASPACAAQRALATLAMLAALATLATPAHADEPATPAPAEEPAEPATPAPADEPAEPATPAPAEDAEDADSVPRRSTVLHLAPSEAPSDRELRLVAMVDAAWTEAALVVRYRAVGAADEFEESAFERSSAGGYYATIPARVMQRPGVEYYIAGTLMDGGETLHFASSTKPHQVVVAPTRTMRWAQRERARLGGHVSSVSLDVRGHSFGNRFGNPDQFIRADLEWTHRLILPTLYAISLGYGFIEGLTPNMSGDTAMSYKQGARYGYGGVTLRLSDAAWIDARAAIGVSRDGFIMGGAAELTLGRPWRANVSIGGEIMNDIGPTLWARLQWDTVPPFLMGAAIYKTDMPNATLTDGSFIVYDIHYPVAKRLSLRGSLSFGSRDGPGGFGGGVGTSLAF